MVAQHESHQNVNFDVTYRDDAVDLWRGLTDDERHLRSLVSYAVQGISQYASRINQLSGNGAEVDRSVVDYLSALAQQTQLEMTAYAELLSKAVEIRTAAKWHYRQLRQSASDLFETRFGPVSWYPAPDTWGLVKQGKLIGPEDTSEGTSGWSPDMRQILLGSLIAAANCAARAQSLGWSHPSFYGGLHRLLHSVAEGPHTEEEFGLLLLDSGKLNIMATSLLRHAYTARYGIPEPIVIRTEPVEGKAILVSGSDLEDLECLLKQSSGRGINVYTHGQMLVAHQYPGLRQHKHLVGHLGGVWLEDPACWESFPGPVLLTSGTRYGSGRAPRDRTFSSGLLPVGKTRRTKDRDFTSVVNFAEAANGFTGYGVGNTYCLAAGEERTKWMASALCDSIRGGMIREVVLAINNWDPHVQAFSRELAACLPEEYALVTVGFDWGGDGFAECGELHSVLQMIEIIADCFDTDMEGLPLTIILPGLDVQMSGTLAALLNLGLRKIRIGRCSDRQSPAAPRFLTDMFGAMPIGCPTCSEIIDECARPTARGTGTDGNLASPSREP